MVDLVNFKEELEQRTQSAWAVVEEYLPKEEGLSGQSHKLQYEGRRQASASGFYGSYV